MDRARARSPCLQVSLKDDAAADSDGTTRDEDCAYVTMEHPFVICRTNRKRSPFSPTATLWPTSVARLLVGRAGSVQARENGNASAAPYAVRRLKNDGVRPIILARVGGVV